MTSFTILVRRIMSPLAARVFREPDAAMPKGRMYGLQLGELHDPFGNQVQIKEGDRLTAHVDEADPERILFVERLPADVILQRYSHA